MHTANPSDAAPPAGRNLWRNVRVLAFPLATNMWPLLLHVSQKVFVAPGVLLVGAGDKLYRRDLVIAFVITFIGLLIYAVQFGNLYDRVHLLGFIPFVWAMPLINHATRHDANLLRRTLTFLTIFNLGMSIYLVRFNVDLYGYRGLNRVEGTDGVTYRVYFESSSLAAVFLLTTFRNRWLQLATFAAVFTFIVFFARSAVVMALFAVNLVLPYILRSQPIVKIFAAVVTVAVAIIFYLYLPVVRPDIYLSLQAKQFQLDVIFSLMRDNWFGWGWGAYLPQLATDIEQPYQIEMQLPMLLLQIGPIAACAMLLLILALFQSAAERSIWGYARFAIYALIGFNNPWLFVPSWYLTCQLMFRDIETQRRVDDPAQNLERAEQAP